MQYFIDLDWDYINSVELLVISTCLENLMDVPYVLGELKWEI